MFLRVHDVPGRLRFSSPMLKRNAAAAKEICAQLGAFPGVKQASANPNTGSLIVYYDGASVTRSDILSLVQVARLPIGSQPGHDQSAAAPQPDLIDMVVQSMAERLLERMVQVAVAALI